jgi:hypothetical protein
MNTQHDDVSQDVEEITNEHVDTDELDHGDNEAHQDANVVENGVSEDEEDDEDLDDDG